MFSILIVRVGANILAALQCTRQQMFERTVYMEFSHWESSLKKVFSAYSVLFAAACEEGTAIVLLLWLVMP